MYAKTYVHIHRTSTRNTQSCTRDTEIAEGCAERGSIVCIELRSYHAKSSLRTNK